MRAPFGARVEQPGRQHAHLAPLALSRCSSFESSSCSRSVSPHVQVAGSSTAGPMASTAGQSGSCSTHERINVWNSSTNGSDESSILLPNVGVVGRRSRPTRTTCYPGISSDFYSRFPKRPNPRLNLLWRCPFFGCMDFNAIRIGGRNKMRVKPDIYSACVNCNEGLRVDAGLVD